MHLDALDHLPHDAVAVLRFVDRLRHPFVQRIDAPQAEQQRGYKAVLLLEAQLGELAQMLSCDGLGHFGVAVRFLFAAGGLKDVLLDLFNKIIGKNIGA